MITGWGRMICGWKVVDIVKKIAFILVSFLIIAVLNGGCNARLSEDGSDLEKETWPVMGTFASVSVRKGQTNHLADYSMIIRECFREAESLLSIFDPESEVSELNMCAGGPPVKVSENTFCVLMSSLKYAGITDGCFDFTVAPLVRMWGFNGGTPPREMLPAEAVSELLNIVGYRYLVLSNGSARLALPGVKVDLGGIAKGHAVDLGYEKLVLAGAKNVLINLGGNMRCMGTAREKGAWVIGIRDPFDRDEIVGIINLTNGMAVASSGNYERFVTIGNKRYAHIIDPRTGYPVEGVAGVTVVSASAVEADAVSTALFVAGVSGARSILARLPGCSAMIIDDSQPMRIWVSEGFSKHFIVRTGQDSRIRLLP